jgi:putative SOS response-associated peptidase YedK
MCTNYRPGSRDFIAQRFGVGPDFDYADEAYPASAAPIIRRVGGQMQCVRAGFGLVPHWARDTKIARSTYNARSETVAEKPSFRRPWRLAQFCLVPMNAFYEPDYETGRALRWRIARADGRGFAVAGIWDAWRSPTGAELLSFSMLTINADAHPLMRRFHAPGDEKRSVVVIDPADDARWLRGEDVRALLAAFAPHEFAASPDPRPPSGRTRAPAPDPSSIARRSGPAG